ncbi:hypothetical protein [Paracoccus sp. (in: a-proteobacteria)]|uniref:hypothetical protein n=1 Tax=Paracoccus sp. TaxID=267 RepID=UPI00396C9E14
MPEFSRHIIGGGRDQPLEVRTKLPAHGKGCCQTALPEKLDATYADLIHSMNGLDVEKRAEANFSYHVNVLSHRWGASLMDTYLSAARDLVVEGMRESQVALSSDLEFHLASTLARYMHRPIRPDRLTIRLLHAAQEGARKDESRQIGDECLISCAFFEARLTRQGGTIIHYAGLGQTAYAVAGMPEIADGFPDMLDVLQASCHQAEERPLPRHLGEHGPARAVAPDPKILLIWRKSRH